MYYLFKQCHNLETLNSDHTCEIYLPYRPLHSMVGPHIRIVHIIINLLILRPYLAWTFSAQNLDEIVEKPDENSYVRWLKIHTLILD